MKRTSVWFAILIVTALFFVSPAAAVSLEMSPPEKWNSGAADGANLSVKEVDGEKGKGVSMSYDFSGGDWAQIWQDVALNLAGMSAVQLNVRGDGGKNRLEVKLVDADGTNFGVRLEDLAFDNQWHDVNIPFSKFEYFWGGDDKLDLAHVVSVWLAVSKMDGGAGEVGIDQVELVTSSAAPAKSPAGSGGKNAKIPAGTYKLESADFAKLSLALDPARRDPSKLRVKVGAVDDGMSFELMDESGRKLGQARLVGEDAASASESSSTPPDESSAGGYKFDMESPDDWTAQKADGVDLTVAQSAGKSGNAIDLQYKMATGEWLQISQEKQMSLSLDHDIFVRFRLTGSKNRVELKLADADGTNFGLKFEDLTPSDRWVEKTAPLKSFTYFWGGDDKMDWSHVVSIWVAVAKIDGGAGKLSIDEIRLTP